MACNIFSASNFPCESFSNPEMPSELIALSSSTPESVGGIPGSLTQEAQNTSVVNHQALSAQSSLQDCPVELLLCSNDDCGGHV